MIFQLLIQPKTPSLTPHKELHRDNLSTANTTRDSLSTMNTTRDNPNTSTTHQVLHKDHLSTTNTTRDPHARTSNFRWSYTKMSSLLPTLLKTSTHITKGNTEMTSTLPRQPEIPTPHKKLHRHDLSTANATRKPPPHTSQGATQRETPPTPHQELHRDNLSTANTPRDTPQNSHPKKIYTEKTFPL